MERHNKKERFMACNLLCQNHFVLYGGQSIHMAASDSVWPLHGELRSVSRTSHHNGFGYDMITSEGNALLLLAWMAKIPTLVLKGSSSCRKLCCVLSWLQSLVLPHGCHARSP
ncbi:hypothetical protein AKJ16_DCAP08610 [Drosera capensis]